MKKIVFVIERMSTGGAERVVAALANEICKYKEYEVHIFTYLPKEEDEYCLSSEVIRHEMPKTEFGRIKTILFKGKFLRRELKKINPYCVLSLATPKTNLVLTAALTGRKCPFIISERNDPARFPQQKIMRVMRTLNYALCEGLVFQTPGAKAYFPEFIGRKGVVISNPLSSTLPECYKGIREKRIVNFCRIEPQKNLKMLIDAFALIEKEFADYTLEIYGEGSEKIKLISYVNEMNLTDRIIFHSYSPHIHEDIVKSALFVSSSDYEGISNSMLESIAIGVPTICTDCPSGGAAATIDDGVNGLLVPVKDASKMAEAMRKVLRNQTLARELSNNGAKLKQELSVDRVCLKWLEYIEKAK